MFLLKQKGWVAIILLLIGLNAYAWAPGKGPATQLDNTVAAMSVDDGIPPPPKDPLEGFNRAMFCFNESFDKWIWKPLGKLYSTIVPGPLSRGFHNIFVTITEPATIANDLMQFHFQQSAKDISRLGINLTFGIAGFFDVGSRVGLPHFSNDFGLTMAYWGWENSSYLVLPFLGSNTIRDGLGIPVDYYGFYIYPRINPFSTRLWILAWFYVDYRANALAYEPVLEEVAVDKYVFMRNAYLQRRAWQLDQLRQLGCQPCSKGLENK